MEAGLALDLFALVGERRASCRDDAVEVGERRDVPVDDGFVDEGPQRLRRLDFRGVGGWKTRRMPSGTSSPASPCQPALSRVSTMRRPRPAPASSAKAFKSASKNGFDTPSETYQKVSPDAGETNAVTYSHSKR